MERKPLVLITAIIFLTGVYSCKKPESGADAPVRDRLLGGWKMIKYGIDSVNEGVLDTGEADSLQGVSYSYYYHTDGSGWKTDRYFSGGTEVIDSLAFDWILSEDKKKIISTYTSVINPVIDSIHTITTNTLITLDKTANQGGSFNHWKVMEKQ